MAFLVVGLAGGYYVRMLASAESTGERLERECASIIDTVGVGVSQMDVLKQAEEDSAVRGELDKKFRPFQIERSDYLRQQLPEVWQAARKRALDKERAAMIRGCVLKRGMASG